MITILARNDRTAVTFSCRQIKLLTKFVELFRENFVKGSCEFSSYLKPFRIKKTIKFGLKLIYEQFRYIK